MMTILKLTVNEQKTHICRVPAETFDFLGYTVGRCWSWKKHRWYIGTKPSQKRITRFRQAVHEVTTPRWELKTVEDRVKELNRMLTGWANYFCLGTVKHAYETVDAYVQDRLRQWLRRKHKVQGSVYTQDPDRFLYDQLGLVRLTRMQRHLPRATA
jgi:hypothetical protein